MRMISSSETVTQKHIAERLGLSLSTVGYALSGTGTISEQTRQKILKTAQEMNYHLNHSASALARLRTSPSVVTDVEPVAILYHHDASDRYGMMHYQRELDEYVVPLGLRCTYYNLREYKHMDSLGRMLHARGYRGIILDRIMSQTDFTGFPWEHFSVVAVGRQIYEWPFDTVRTNPAASIRQAYDEVQKRGYLRPGVCLIKHEAAVIDDRDRLGEVLAFNHLCKGKRPVPVFQESDRKPGISVDTGLKIEQWFRRYKPDVIIGFSSNQLRRLQAAGIILPGEAGFLALHVDIGDVIEREVSGFTLTNGLSKVALDRLSFLIRHNRKGRAEPEVASILKQEWNEGSTLPVRREGPVKSPATRRE
ncbi:MAG: LacI family DNA-binding transcriptional regulator [Verrucomicrobiota bacterium]|nr:LacI family DNA-binding transcriptional regulator [Verrucomicrobiota bacterium]